MIAADRNRSRDQPSAATPPPASGQDQPTDGYVSPDLPARTHAALGAIAIIAMSRSAGSGA